MIHSETKLCIKVVIVTKDGMKRLLFSLIDMSPKIFRRITNFNICSNVSVDWISLKQSFFKINFMTNQKVNAKDQSNLLFHTFIFNNCYCFYEQMYYAMAFAIK